MHLRKLVLVCGFAVTLLANYANALGLGEISLNSSLNQPLNAEIKLLDVRDLTADQIIVALGSPADFERNGVDRLFFYSEFNFEVSLNNPGGAIVRITTRGPVREPYLNFLIEARWSTGRLLREYTLLMDLPTFGDSPAAPVESATSYPQTISQPRASSTVKTPVRQAEPTSTVTKTSPRPARRSSGSRAGSDSYGPVDSNDTLWQIALDVRPDRSLSVHQTMLALQRLNPEAFINGNINLLRKGQVLRLPSADEIRSISRGDAVAEVAVQNRDWSDNSMGAQLNASRRDSSTRREAEVVSGRVKLAAPNGENASSGQGSGGNAGDGKALENELAGTLEELDKTRSENTELTSRVRDLEEQIETMERLVDVSNEQLRAMQLAASQQQEAPSSAVESDQIATSTDLPSAEAIQEDTTASELTTPEVAISETTPEEVVQASEPVVAEPVAPPVRDVTRTIPATPKPKSFVDHIIDNALWVGLGLLVLLGLIYAVIRRRNENAEDDDSARDDDIFTMPTHEDDQVYDEDALLDASDDFESEEEPLFDEDDLPAEAETGDVVGEADIYIAYGKFDQAEEMLLNGLAKEPQSVDIRLKLLEVYSQTQDISKFDQYYASLLGIASHGALQRAAELRENIAGAGEFEADLRPASDDSIDLAQSEDTIDFGLDDDVYSESTDTLKNQSIDDEFSFDLDLDDESSESLDLGEALAHESEVGKSTTRYDLSFEEEQTVDIESTDEISLDFDSDEELVLEEPDAGNIAPGVALDDEEILIEDELHELSFDLDDESEIPAKSVTEAEENDEFSFDFDEAESLVEVEDRRVEPKTAASEGLGLSDDGADDFNLDMDMGDLDLEALDHEMESLDAEFGANDGRDFGELDAEPESNLLELKDEPVVSSTDVADAEEDVFDQALSDFSAPNDSADDMSEIGSVSDDDMDAELDFLADTDEAATKLDLARAYIDMGDTDGARDILAEVAHEGNQQQREEATELLGRIDA